MDRTSSAVTLAVQLAPDLKIHRETIFRGVAWGMGRDQVETPLDVFVGVDPAFGCLVATTIVDGGWWIDDGAGVPWVSILRKERRARIRAAARASKSRRGYR